jgi:hypothetical protein
MITKTIFFAKTFYTYSMKNLRPKKSLRDHPTGRKPAYRPQDIHRTSGHAGNRAPPPGSTRIGTTRPAPPARHHPGPAPRRETPQLP